jgi:hypothetical protein
LAQERIAAQQQNEIHVQRQAMAYYAQQMGYVAASMYPMYPIYATPGTSPTQFYQNTRQATEDTGIWSGGQLPEVANSLAEVRMDASMSLHFV